MARNSLRNLSAGTHDAPNESAGTPKPEAGQLPEDLRALLHERKTLEAQMSALTGRSQNSGDARFPVTPLSTRRATDAAWAMARDRFCPRGASLGNLDKLDKSYDGYASQISQASEAAIAEPPERTGQRAIGALAERTGLRDLMTDLPEPRLPDRPDALARAAERLDILRGGSGDLDELRSLAQSRRAARRKEERGFERHQEQSDPDAGRDADRLDRRYKQRDPDAKRDEARLNRRDEREGRSEDV